MEYSKILKWSLVLGIIIVLNLFFNYAITVFYEEPKYEDFCIQTKVVEEIKDQNSCLNIGGQWVAGNMIGGYRQEVAPSGNFEVKPTLVEGYCNRDFTCSKNYEDVRKVYERNVFVILIFLGVVSVVAGFLLASFEPLATAFSLGGVLTFIIASIRYWSSAEDWARLLILTIALVVLVWLGVKKFKE